MGLLSAYLAQSNTMLLTEFLVERLTLDTMLHRAAHIVMFKYVGHDWALLRIFSLKRHSLGADD